MVGIQKLVDELADRLQRSVAVDGPRGHLIASSQHFGDEDTPRIRVVLSRRLDRRVAQYLFSFGIQDAFDKVVIPSEPSLDLKTRCCYPLRYQQRLLGFIWLIEDIGQEDLIRPYVEQIAEALGQEHDSVSANVLQLGKLGRQLLSARRPIEQVTSTLREHGFPPDDSQIRLIAVAQPIGQSRGVSFPTLRTSASAREWTRAGRDVIEVNLASAATLVCGSGKGRDDGIAEFASRISSELSPTKVHIGVSDSGGMLDARMLLRQALISAFASQIFEELDSVSLWSDIFLHRLVMEMAVRFPEDAQMPESMNPLFEPDNLTLLKTVEFYLDRGGDRTATSEALFIHRSTLHYRLNQVQKLTGLDPTDGCNRMALHLATKLNRVAGREIAALLQNVEDLD